MATRRSTTRLDELLCLDLYAASRAAIKAYGPLLDPLGLTYPQYLVMVALWESGALTVKDLSERLSLDSGTLSPLLKRLEAAGLVARSRNTDDERVVTISLTAAGRSLEEKAAAVCSSIACLFDLNTAELRKLQSTLRAIAQRMETPEAG